MTSRAYSIGSDHLPGLSKLIEEAGEVTQVAGKIMGLGHMGDHWDGSNLAERLEEEMGDLGAAMAFFGIKNGLNEQAVRARMDKKLALFMRWHDEGDPAP